MPNNLSAAFIELLSCPKTGESVELVENQIRSIQTKVHYPIVNDTPWMLTNPLHSMVDWSVKLNHFRQILSDEVKALNIQKQSSHVVTHKRLNKLIEGKLKFIDQVTQLVSPILKAKVSSKPIYDALSDRAPSSLNLLSYEANIYRDWVWGEKENQQSLNIVERSLGNTQVNKLLVLGAGSCRLALDLHNKLNPKLTIANDINPLLLLAAKQIITEADLDLVEFPAHPKSTDSSAIFHTICALKKPPENFYFLFADAAKPAIKKHCIDLIVTPWLVDVQPLELSQFANAINQYLPIGGTWCNFGSLVFNQNQDAHCYSIDEITMILAEQGFELETQAEDTIPYLQSPYNAGYRIETVFSWRAKKVKHTQQNNKHQNLPDWIINSGQPIPQNSTINNYLNSYQLYSEILSLIDDKKSINKIAKLIAKKYQIDVDESLAMMKDFFKKL